MIAKQECTWVFHCWGGNSAWKIQEYGRKGSWGQ